MTLHDFAQDALNCQSAVNAAGVAYSLHSFQKWLYLKEHGTDSVNTHPICRLYIAKLADLAQMTTQEGYRKAIKEVRAIPYKHSEREGA